MFQISPSLFSLVKNTMLRKYKPCHVLTVLQSTTRSYAINRFYEKTNIIENNDSYGVLLDNSKLKTPLGKELVVHSKALALAISKEWDLQKISLQTHSMHLTKLCFLAVDNPTEISEHEVVQQILSYLETDTVLFISDSNEELELLLMNKWMPLIKKFNEFFEINLKPSKGIYVESLNTNTKSLVEKYLMSLGFPALHGILLAVETLKSLVLTICCLHQDISVNDAVLLSKMEEEYQCMKWNRVDWTKDYIDNDSIIRLSAAMIYIYYTLNMKHKPLVKLSNNVQSQQSLNQ